jgi:hypothetical protein
MKKISNRVQKKLLLVVLLTTISLNNSFAQRSTINPMIIQSVALSARENNYAEHILKSDFVLNHWFAEISMDPHAGELEILLPENDPVLFILDVKREQASDLISWRGKSVNNESSISLVWHKGMVTAVVTINPKLVYRIQPIGGNRHIIYRVNQKYAPKEEPKASYEKMSNREWVLSEEMQSDDREETNDNNNKFSGSDCYIRILVGFDNVAGPSIADPIGFALECITLSNEIYSGSEVNFEVELALAKTYAAAASTDIDDALAEWQFDFGEGKFNDVFSDREQFDADFCILITEDFVGDYVGLAATILASYSSAFCVVEDGAAIDNLSFTHEIGHLMGARHDLYVDGSGDYNHGYIIHSEKVRTVMAYNDECDDNGYYCDRVKFFSNPDIDYNGTGKALGDAAEEHNERALDENESAFKDLEPIVTNKNFLFPETFSGEEYGSITALSSITHTATYEVNDGANMVWSSGDEMTLKPGFFVETGSQFEAKTAGCNATKLGEDGNMANTNMESEFNFNIYPDPATNKTTVSFQLEKKSNVTFSLLDLMGRILQESNAQLFEPGTHDFPVNLREVAAGTYICILTIDGERIVKKMIVQQD